MFPMSDSPDSGYYSLSSMIDEFNMENQQFEVEDEHVVIKKEVAVNTCQECCLDITDRQLFRVGEDQYWHLGCLRCSQCRIELDDCGTCYMRDQNVFCKRCYTSVFTTYCSACRTPITAGDWFRRAEGYAFHLRCFNCDVCKVHLSTGENFVMVGSRLRCESHSIKREEPGLMMDQKSIIEAAKFDDASSTCTSSSDDTLHSAEASPKRKRIRTSFNEPQLEVLRYSFNLEENPDTVRMQRIADMAGLTKRVTQVWFQNARSRVKKKRNSATIPKRTVTATNVTMGDFGMAQILNGTHPVPLNMIKYQQHIPQMFHFS